MFHKIFFFIPMLKEQEKIMFSSTVLLQFLQSGKEHNFEYKIFIMKYVKHYVPYMYHAAKSVIFTCIAFQCWKFQLFFTYQNLRNSILTKLPDKPSPLPCSSARSGMLFVLLSSRAWFPNLHYLNRYWMQVNFVVSQFERCMRDRRLDSYEKTK